MYTIKLFMWGYQHYFQTSAECAAESIFTYLDKRLKPKVFLIGVLYEEKENSYPICLQPEDCGYYPEQFLDIKDTAIHLESIEEDNKILHSHPIAQERHELYIHNKSIKSAIESILSELDKESDTISFCSMPIAIEGYMVCTVLQLSCNVLNFHYSLTKKSVADRFNVETSLINATINVFLTACSKALTEPNPGSNHNVIDRGAEELIRSAGKVLMYTPACAGQEFTGLHGLFDACNMISSLKYEGEEGIGNMVVSRREHPNVKVVLSLISPVRISEYRAVRKLLELSSKRFCLLSDSGYIYGFGHIDGCYDEKEEDLFTIYFTKHYTWELVHAGNVLMSVAYTQPQLPKQRMDETKFKSDVFRIFKNICKDSLEVLWNLVLKATEQKHGTMVVVSTGAKEEANRLAKQCTLVEPVHLTTEIMQQITGIDGAVLLGSDCICYAIGVILDGLASNNGTPSRGARYNSAIRYVESSEYPCLSIVISEDGSIDLIPDLMPQIHCSQILDAISKLKAVRNSSEVNAKEFYGLMKWFQDHKFYLIKDYCDEINELRKEIEEKVGNVNIRIVYYDFIPNDEMNETYFYEES
jgi:DNA integrity scanning protein DisA with diadenylate cyclase activity